MGQKNRGERWSPSTAIAPSDACSPSLECYLLSQGLNVALNQPAGMNDGSIDMLETKPNSCLYLQSFKSSHQQIAHVSYILFYF